MLIRTSAAAYVLGAVALMGPSLLVSSPAAAQTAKAATPAVPQLAEVIVTAEKRSENANNVGMAITAVSGQDLKTQQVRDVEGLQKIDPTFVVSGNNYGAPIYSIRGVNYNDYALSASPTVSVYSDEVAYAYPITTKGATYDLDHVEVLKGPQGTLYGQNSTGGAVNYVSAKPTRSFAAGFEATYGSYGAANFNGYVSGPVSDTLSARLAVNLDNGGAWQKSATREDTLGDKDSQKIRLLLDWRPTDKLSVAVNLNGWVDRSDTQAPQFVAMVPNRSAFLVNLPDLANTKQPRQTDRLADWLHGTHPHRHEDYGQGSVRADYYFDKDLQFTYLATYEAFSQNNKTDPSGGDFIQVINDRGRIASYQQEARLSGKAADEKLIWLAGVSYAENFAWQDQIQDIRGVTSSYGFVPTLIAAHLPGIPQTGVNNLSRDDSKSGAVFFNLEYQLTEHLKVHGGARYTETDIDHGGCYKDVNGGTVAGTNLLEQTVQAAAHVSHFVPVTPGGCLTFGTDLTPQYIRQSLDENNVSWRVGADWKPLERTLVYGTISRGYKAGSFPSISAQTQSSLAPVVQEQLTAYEVGVKSRLWDGRLQLDASTFYYDYVNKQLAGRLPDPFGLFGVINALVNIPKSEEFGVEVGVKVTPVENLVLSVQGAYLDTMVTSSMPGYDGFGVATNFKGDAFPDAPRYAVLADGQYSWRLTDAFNGFVGVNVKYRSKSQSQLGTYAFATPPFPSPTTEIPDYTLLALRAGVTSTDGHWRVQAFGNNVTNTYYWTHSLKLGDAVVRYTGMPATFGVNLSYTY